MVICQTTMLIQSRKLNTATSNMGLVFLQMNLKNTFRFTEINAYAQLILCISNSNNLSIGCFRFINFILLKEA